MVTHKFDINAGVLQWDTLAPLLFIITLDYVLRTSIDENKNLGLISVNTIETTK